SPPDEPQAMALSTFFLLILFVLVVCYRLLLQRAHIAATLTGKGARLLARERTAGAYVVAGLLFSVLAVTVVLPFAMVAMSSFSTLFGFFGIEHPWTTEHWREGLQRPAFVSALRQSVLIGTVVALVGTLIYLPLPRPLRRSPPATRSAARPSCRLRSGCPGPFPACCSAPRSSPSSSTCPDCGSPTAPRRRSLPSSRCRGCRSRPTCSRPRSRRFPRSSRKPR